MSKRPSPAAPGFDWHSDPITRATPVTETYRNTQNVRRFFRQECGDGFSFDRPFMAWMKDGSARRWRRRKEWLVAREHR